VERLEGDELQHPNDADREKKRTPEKELASLANEKGNHDEPVSPLLLSTSDSAI
jgi:hypothetical protein